MLYKAVYKIVDISDIRRWVSIGKSREWMEQEILNLSINRLVSMNHNVFEEIEDVGVIIEEIRYFVTDCNDSFRKRISPKYKAKRKRNKWVRKLRTWLLSGNYAISSNIYEADDLIHEEARILRENNEDYIVLSMDKDLKQIEGLHFNYYKVRDTKESRGLCFVTKKEAEELYLVQLLCGDKGDGIDGIHGVGMKTASKILNDESFAEKKLLSYSKKYGYEGDLFYFTSISLIQLFYKITGGDFETTKKIIKIGCHYS